MWTQSSIWSVRVRGQVTDQLVSRRKDHGQVSIIMSVLIDDIWLYNILDTIAIICRKETPFRFFLDAVLKTVAYPRISTRSQGRSGPTRKTGQPSMGCRIENWRDGPSGSGLPVSGVSPFVPVQPCPWLRKTDAFRPQRIASTH